MTERIKKTYFYELTEEAATAEKLRRANVCEGYTILQHTEDLRKNVGKMVFSKTSSVQEKLT